MFSLPRRIVGTDLTYPEDVNIALDVDSVLANFRLQFCRWAKKLGVEFWDHSSQWMSFDGGKYSAQFREVWDEVKDNDEFWLTVPKKQSAYVPFDDVHCYITGRPVESELTQAWLGDHGFPEAPVHTVGPRSTKTGVLRATETDVFVDDHLRNVRAAYKAGAVGVMMETPASRGDMHRAVQYKASGEQYGGIMRVGDVTISYLSELEPLLTSTGPGSAFSTMLSDPYLPLD